MHLIRWNGSPSRDLQDLRHEVDRLFDSVFPAPRGSQNHGAFVPPVDVEETADAYLIRADLPGVPQKDVKVTLTDDTLTIRGERQHEAKQGMHRVERRSGSFERSFTLATPVRADGIEAVYRDGVLEVRVPKAEEAKPREIPVRVAS